MFATMATLTIKFQNKFIVSRARRKIAAGGEGLYKKYLFKLKTGYKKAIMFATMATLTIKFQNILSCPAPAAKSRRARRLA